MPLTIQPNGELHSGATLKVTAGQPLFVVYFLLSLFNFAWEPHPADTSPVDDLLGAKR